MTTTFGNLIHVLKRFKLASITNLIGMSLSFFLFMLIGIHVYHEYSFDSSIENKNKIYQLENMRNDGIWESNFSRPQMERFIAASPRIEAAAVTNNLSYTSFRFGVSAGSGPDALSYMETLERINKGYTEVFGFEMIAGDTKCLGQPNTMLIAESISQKLFGGKDPVGQPVYLSEFRGIGRFTYYGLNFESTYTVGGVYRDFPENTRVKNAMYIAIQENEMMDDWFTGPYYCYVMISSPEAASDIVEQYMSQNKDFLENFSIEDLRLRPLTNLYFGEQVRADAAPTGNKLRTNMLLFIAVLIISIALINYINLSVALAPVRTKSITTRKVLGCDESVLKQYLVSESVALSIISFAVAFVVLILLHNSPWITAMLGHQVNLPANLMIIAGCFVLVLVTGILAGLYPAFYMTSFPPATALNGSFSLSVRAQNTRKLLIGFQFVISIALIIGSLFVYLQNKYLGNVNLGFEKENVLEVKLSMGTASAKSELFKNLVMEHPDIKGVAYNEFKFVSDESRSWIGYHYKNNHSYMSWFGVSPDFPQLMDIQLIAGRYFRPADQAPDNTLTVCMINETAARDIIARLSPDEIITIPDLVGTSIQDNNVEVQIVGVFKDVHYESLYKEIRPLGFWTSARNQYRHVLPQNYSYVKIAGSNPEAAIKHIRNVIHELNPGYPADIRFFDSALNELYNKSHQQSLLVTILCVVAVILSLVGVFGLVIFESQGREKEIAIRKVFGATVKQILWMFNFSFFRLIAAGFIISVPLAYVGVNKWLQSFAYKTPLYIWVFFIALLVIILLTALTVTLQSYRVATANPAPKLSR